jgi:peptide/nickel transport system permease protein
MGRGLSLQAATVLRARAASHLPIPPSPHAVRFTVLQINGAALFGASILLAFVLAAVLADWIAPHDYAAQDLAGRFGPPSFSHPLGTDHLGRDVLSRLIFGARVSLAVGLIATGLALLVGVPVGAAAGYVGGRFDLGAMWLMDLLLAFPALLLAIAVASVLGPGIGNAMLAIALVSVPSYARLVRAAVLSVRSADYVEACRALGASGARVLARHILPNIAGVVIVRATLGLGAVILTEAGLSFLGLGAQPPDPSWGAMLNEGRVYLRREAALATLPGLCIMVSILAFNLLGDGLRDALDPRLRCRVKGAG